MAKKSENTSVHTTNKASELLSKQLEEQSKQPLNLTHVAFGTFKGPKGWQVAKVMYNPETGQTGAFERIGEGEDRITAIERFKIEVGKTKILGD